MNTAVERQNPIVAQDERSAIALKIDAALFRGDVSKLTDEERVIHMRNVCESIGVNPATTPIGYITLPNGKMVPYVYKGGTDQLRQLHGVNIEIVNRTAQGDLLTVHARATDKTGRRDEDFGVVSIAGLRGEAAANALMRATTKAKRRVTLSICGLGWLDESEVEDIPGAFVQSDETAEPPTKRGNRGFPWSPERRAAFEAKHDERRVGRANPDTYKEDLRRDLNAQPTDAYASGSREITASPDTPAPVEDIEPYELEHTENSEDEWKRWGNDLFAYIKAAKTFERIDEWIVANGDGFEALKHYDVGKFNRLRHMIQAVQDAKAKAAQDEPR